MISPPHTHTHTHTHTTGIEFSGGTTIPSLLFINNNLTVFVSLLPVDRLYKNAFMDHGSWIMGDGRACNIILD